MYRNVQGLRAIAVLLVVCSHFNGFADRYHYDFDALNAYGQWGVDLFFVISGFIMITVHWSNFRDPGIAKTFLLRRFIRILPMYWLLTLAIAAAFAVSPHLARGWDASANLAASLALVPMNGFPLLFVGWTLVFEMYFYYVFAVLLNVSRDRALAAIGVWAAIILAAQFVPSVGEAPWSRVYLGNIVLEFAFGVAVGALVRGARLPRPRTAVACGIAFLGVTVVVTSALHLDTSPLWRLRFLAVGLPMALIVYGTVALDLRGHIVPRFLQSLGDASYSIYLCHAIFYAALGHLLVAAAPSWIPPLGLMLLAPVPVVAASLVAYRFLEIPSTRAAKRLTARVFPRSMAAPRAAPARVAAPVAER